MKNAVVNLAKAFVGESQARNRYTFYASAARREGFEQIADVFLITADNEKQHAKWFMRMLGELKAQSSENLDEITVEAAAPTILSTTAENLEAAVAGENHEHTDLYPRFAAVAEEEGLPEFAERIRAISRAEEHHEERFKKLLANMAAGTVFVRDREVAWLCRECGYVHVGKEAPEKCPSCDHPRAFYQLKCEEY